MPPSRSNRDRSTAVAARLTVDKPIAVNPASLFVVWRAWACRHVPARNRRSSTCTTGVAVATNNGSVSWIAMPGAQPAVLARIGVALTSLAAADNRLVGVSPHTGLLYQM